MNDNVAAGNVFARSWWLLSHNWIIVVPSIVIGALGGVLLYALAVSGGASWAFLTDLNGRGPGAFALFASMLVAFAVRIVGSILSVAYTTGMAGAAWERGHATLADGTRVFRHDGAQVALAMLLLFLFGIVAAFLAIPTFFLSVAAYMVFALYTMPAVIVGKRPAAAAVVDSLQIAAKNFATTLLVVAIVVAVAAVGGVAGRLAGAVPVLGQAIGLVVMQAVVAYATLVVVGEYLRLRSSILEQPPVPPPGP